MSNILEKAINLGFSGGVAKLSDIARLSVPSKNVFPTSIPMFDKAMDGGLREGELITISGISGQGKTTYTLNLAIRLSDLSVPSLYFSYEMDNYYLNQNFKKIRNEDMLVYSPLELTSGSLEFIEESIKDGVENQAIKVVFIDHLHFLISMKNSTNASLMIGGIVRELKKMAIKHKVIIFLIAHTRKINTGDVLGVSSIRDSGMIVAESDYVMMVSRKRKVEVRAMTDEIDYGDGREFINVGRVEIIKNRRTGNMCYQDFTVENGRFVEKIKETEV